MIRKTSKFDVAEYLKTDEDYRAFLEVAAEEGDDRAILRALDTVARAKGMTEVARLANISRTSLYKTLSDDGNPNFFTVNKLLKVFGCKLSVSK